MYDIVFSRAYWDLNNGVRLHTNLTKEQAMDARRVSGDLVVHASTTTLVLEDWWLWEWEKHSTESYALRAISWYA